MRGNFTGEEIETVREGIRTFGVQPTPIWREMLPHRDRATVRCWVKRIAHQMSGNALDTDEDEAEGRFMALAGKVACHLHLQDLKREHGKCYPDMAFA